MVTDVRPPVERTVTLAVLGTDAAARLDRHGGLRPDGRGWWLDWAVGAQDGWHLASTEAVVRQSLLGAAPVVVSALRVPDGAVEQRCWAAVAGGRPVVVVELHSAVPVAVAVAVVVRPAGDGRVDAIDLDGLELRVDDRVASVLGRAPSRAVVGPADTVLPAIVAGVAESAWPDGGARSDTGDLAAALVFPLPHTATLRFVVPLTSREDEVLSDVATLPGHGTVTSGWQAQTAGGPRIDLPEREVETAVIAASRHLLGRVGDGRPVDVRGEPLGVDTVAEMAMALDEQGLHVASRALLEGVLDRQGSDGSFDRDRIDVTARVLVALDRHRRLADDDALVARAIESIASAAHWLHRRRAGSPLRRGSRFFGRRGAVVDPAADDERRASDARWASCAFDAAARSLRAVGQVDAAALVAERATALRDDMARRGIDDDVGPGRPPADALVRLRALLVEGEPLWTWPSVRDGDDPARTAAFLRLVRSMLVDDSGEGLDLFPGTVDEWSGSPVAVHDLPTAFGRLSFAVRWHGSRPALLWDLATVDRSPAVPVRLTAPGLDPSWSSVEPRSEALLAEPPHEHEHGDGGAAVTERPTRPVADGRESFM